MKLSREKVLHISHLILDYLDSDDGVEYFDEPQEIRQTIVKIIMDEMQQRRGDRRPRAQEARDARSA